MKPNLLSSLTTFFFFVIFRISFAGSLEQDLAIVRHILDQNTLTSLPVTDVSTIENNRIITLDFRTNQNVISYISDSIEYLDALTSLNLFSQPLNSLPESIGNLKSLTEIYIEDALFHSLPSSICRLINLNHLYISRTPLDSLPDSIGLLQELRHLYCNSTDISVIPPSIGNLKKLVYLNIDNSKLSIIPKEIGGLISLDELNLGGNRITSLPNEIMLMTNMRTLTISNNALSSLPDSMVACTGLVKLAINNNSLQVLPDSIQRLKNLYMLSVQNNRLTSLPHSIINTNISEWHTVPKFCRIGVTCGIDTNKYIDVRCNYLCGLQSDIKGWLDSRDPLWHISQTIDSSHYCNGEPVISTRNSISKTRVISNMMLKKSILYLSFEKAQIPVKALITSVNGRSYLSHSISDQQVGISLKGYPPGVYILRLQNNHNSIVSKFIIREG